MLMSPPAAIASMNALVPDFAMVPRLLISSFLVMPMPESSMVKVGVRLVGDDFDEEVGLGLQNDDNADALQNDDDTVALGLQNA